MEFIRKKVLLIAFVFTLIGSISWADVPFVMDLHYDTQTSTLTIDLERTSRDEVEHFMQKLVVRTSDTVPKEESLINQNYLNEIKKVMSFFAQPGDVIAVELHYGKEGVFKKEITIPVQEKKIESKVEVNKSSILVPREYFAEPEKEKLKISPEENRQKRLTQMLQREQARPYGHKTLGYESQEEVYGYQEKLEGDFHKDVYGHEIYGYEIKKEEHGYSDPGRTDHIQEGFGYKDFGYKGSSESYGKTEY